jgi:hypothetical protein
MFDLNVIPGTREMLLAAFLASSIPGLPAGAQSPAPDATPAQAPAPAAPAPPAASAAPSRYQPSRIPKRAAALYGLVWGVESLRVKLVESGEIVRFSYSVVDPDKAKALNDKKFAPILIDPQAGVKLEVPTLDKVGQLRQSSTPEMGKSYWMAFSNKGRIVKRGDRVNIVIGQFRAEGLQVD